MGCVCGKGCLWDLVCLRLFGLVWLCGAFELNFRVRVLFWGCYLVLLGLLFSCVFTFWVDCIDWAIWVVIVLCLVVCMGVLCCFGHFCWLVGWVLFLVCLLECLLLV